MSGRLKEGVNFERAEKEINTILEQVVSEGISTQELEKVKNQAESTLEFGEVEVMNRAMNLAFSKLSGDANLVNEEGEKINAVTQADVKRVAGDILKESNSSVMYYKAKKA
jgi:zinc protease